jgi:hypothetical protein
MRLRSTSEKLALNGSGDLTHPFLRRVSSVALGGEDRVVKGHVRPHDEDILSLPGVGVTDKEGFAILFVDGQGSEYSLMTR